MGTVEGQAGSGCQVGNGRVATTKSSTRAGAPPTVGNEGMKRTLGIKLAGDGPHWQPLLNMGKPTSHVHMLTHVNTHIARIHVTLYHIYIYMEYNTYRLYIYIIYTSHTYNHIRICIHIRILMRIHRRLNAHVHVQM